MHVSKPFGRLAGTLAVFLMTVSVLPAQEKADDPHAVYRDGSLGNRGRQYHLALAFRGGLNGKILLLLR